MAEQWIESARALELAVSPFSLCERASVGLVVTRAGLLLIDENRNENVAIPSKFWWANGREALNQNWETGDFATWIDQSEEWKAFGVSFGLAGLLDMLPFERRGLTARSLSVAGSADWVSATAARKFAYTEGGASPTIADRMIIEQAKLGFITARAVLAQGSKAPSDVMGWNWEAREWDIPPWFWERFTDHGSSSQDWQTGRFSGRGNGPDDVRYVTLHGVYFLKDSLSLLLPNAIEGAAQQVPKNRGGRPPAAFADDLMCAIFGLIHQGDFEPKNQADVEKAMLDWAARNDHELSLTVARGKARKVFAALTTEVGNSAR